MIARSSPQLTNGEYIDDNGDIVGDGVLPNGEHRIFLLIPNDSLPLPRA